MDTIVRRAHEYHWSRIASYIAVLEPSPVGMAACMFQTTDEASRCGRTQFRLDLILK